MIDLKYINSKLEEFATNHANIETYGYGPLDQINAIDRKYPLMWLTSSPSKIYETNMEIKYECYILTNAVKDHSNLQDAMNDTFMIALDINAAFKDSDLSNYELMLPMIPTPVTLDFDAVTCGWVVNLAFDIPINNNCY